MSPKEQAKTDSGGNFIRDMIAADRDSARFEGRVALRGMVDSTQVIRAAEEAARSVAGVVSVENRLIPADLFEHD